MVTGIVAASVGRLASVRRLEHRSCPSKVRHDFRREAMTVAKTQMNRLGAVASTRLAAGSAMDGTSATRRRCADIEADLVCSVCGLPIDRSDPDVGMAAPDPVCGKCFRMRRFDEVVLWDEGR